MLTNKSHTLKSFRLAKITHLPIKIYIHILGCKGSFDYDFTCPRYKIMHPEFAIKSQVQ